MSRTMAKRPQRWRFQWRDRQLVVERDQATGKLYVLVVPAKLRATIWPTLPVLPAELEDRVRRVTVRGLMAGRTEVPEETST